MEPSKQLDVGVENISFDFKTNNISLTVSIAADMSE